MTAPSSSLPLDTYTRRAVRSWWADGLWDFAIAGFFVLLAGWAHILVRVLAFPTWAWPWPFITDEVINPMQTQVMLWELAIIPLAAAYGWGAYKLVDRLKQGWLAPRQGYVQHGFWLKTAPQMWLVYLLLYLGLIVVFGALNLWLAGGARWGSLLCTTAPGAILLVIGQTYALPCYRFSGAAGLLLCGLVEWFLTTNAVFKGPKNFLDVSPELGNPAIPLLIWAVLFAITGALGLAGVLRREPHEQ